MIGLTPVFAAADVSLKASYSGTFSFVDSSHMNLTGAGSATYLGATTMTGAVAMVGPATCAGGFKVHDAETLTSVDDGSQITLSVDDEACPTTPNQQFGTGVYHQLGTYIITGGTGRFAGATGSGTFSCFGDFTNDTFSTTLNGTISRPKY